MVSLIRQVWRLNNSIPEPLNSGQIINKWEIKAAEIVHILFYILLLIICISGYFIATAKGAGIEVFTWFEVPSVKILSEINTKSSKMMVD